jgi:hypothetical protein
VVRHRRFSLMTVPLLALALVGCFREDDENTNEGVDPSPGQIVVEVELTDGGIVMNDEIAAGDLLFEVTNSGEQAHGFTIEGHDGGLESLQPDQLDTLSVTLEPGTYLAYSPVEGDRDAGLELEFTTVETAEQSGAPNFEEGVEPGENNGGGGEDDAP